MVNFQIFFFSIFFVAFLIDSYSLNNLSNLKILTVALAWKARTLLIQSINL